MSDILFGVAYSRHTNRWYVVFTEGDEEFICYEPFLTEELAVADSFIKAEQCAKHVGATVEWEFDA